MLLGAQGAGDSMLVRVLLQPLIIQLLWPFALPGPLSVCMIQVFASVEVQILELWAASSPVQPQGLSGHGKIDCHNACIRSSQGPRH